MYRYEYTYTHINVHTHTRTTYSASATRCWDGDGPQGLARFLPLRLGGSEVIQGGAPTVMFVASKPYKYIDMSTINHGEIEVLNQYS